MYITQQVPSAAPPPPPVTTAMLVAAGPIDARAAIGAGDVRVVRIDPTLVPVGALTDPGQAIGRIATVPLAKNEPLLASKFAVASGTPFTVVPEGVTLGASSPEYRALSINVGDANAVGGTIQPGDVVDIVYALNYELKPGTGGAPIPPGVTTTNPTEHAARIVFERVPILARSASIYTVRLDAATAERLIVLQTSDASAFFLLRAPKDDRATKATGDTLTIETGPFIRIPGVVR